MQPKRNTPPAALLSSVVFQCCILASSATPET